ncbi:MAG TPA: ABC transporter permease [Dongiaceae bacterium]|nr:ABC transporter permease [Dongiaceae bacterium]
MNSLIQDLQFGLRMMRKTPGFTVVAVLVLTVAIGGTTAMFSIINAVLFRPPAVKNPAELVRVYSKEKKAAGTYRDWSYQNYVDLREQNTVFSALAGFTLTEVGVNEGDLTRRSFAALVTANYFATFGVQMAAGRGFLPEEEKPGSAIPSVVVSTELWRRTGSDPALVGKTLRINSRTFQVVGIAPEHFAGTTALFSFDLWLPSGMFDALPNEMTGDQRQRLADRQNHALLLVGRLKPGLTMAAAQPQLQAVASGLERAYPEANRGHTFELGKLSRTNISTNPMKDQNSSATTALLMGTSGAVLLIACLNLANMLSARGAARRREIAIRLSLGASRGRLVRQLLTEGLLLSLLGGAGGLWLASWATKALVASGAPRFPLVTIVFDPRPDWRVLGVTLGFCVLSVLLFALGPAWRISRTNVTSQLKEQVGDELHGKLNRGLWAPRSLLVVGQLALSLALLTAAALFAHGAVKAARANPGFSLDKDILAEVDASLAGYDEARTRQLFQVLADRLRAMPGVQSASFAYLVPLGLFKDSRDVLKAGDDSKSGAGSGASKPEKAVTAGFNILWTDYFKTLGLPVRRGRDFSRLEAVSTSGSRVAIIDEPLANQLWPGVNPLGRQLKFSDRPDVMEVVAVVAGLRNDLNDKAPQPHVYIPFGQEYRAGGTWHVRYTGRGREADAAMLKAVRDTIRSVDPHLPVISVQTMRNFHDEGLLLWFVKLSARLFGIFGGLALFLAVVGVYGVNAFVVARRTREIGIRMALGATARDVLWMVLREGLCLTALGVGIGLLLALAIGLLLRSIVYEASAIDPLAFTVAPLCLGLAATVACYLPARRATRVQPMVALRHE